MKKLHVEYLSSTPSLILALERENAVQRLVDLLGDPDPVVARRYNQHYWTAVFGVDPVMNGVYGTALL